MFLLILNIILFAYKLLAIYDRLDLSDSSLKDENLKRGCITAVIYGMLFGITDEVCMTVASIFSFGSEMKELIPQDMVNNFKKFNLNKNPINQFKNKKQSNISDDIKKLEIKIQNQKQINLLQKELEDLKKQNE